MRFSQQRKAILEYILSVASHPTAYDVFDAVKIAFPEISLGTVYRNLKQLEENDLILSIKRNEVIHYDGNLRDHQHFHCSCCHAIIDLDFSIEEFVRRNKEKIGYEISGYELHVTGICENCKSTKQE